MRRLTSYLLRTLMVACHTGLVAGSLALAFLLRFDLSIPPAVKPLLGVGLWLAVPVKMAVFYIGRVDRGGWRFASIADLFRLFLANLVASIGFTAAGMTMLGPSFPRSIYVIDFLVCFLLTAGARFVARIYNEAIVTEMSRRGRKGILIYGAGAAGMTLLREIRTQPSLGYEVLGFLEDAPRKRNLVPMGVPVLGSGRNAARIVDRFKRRRSVEEIVIAMPSATGRQMREALANCRAAGVTVKTIPGIGELLTGKVLSAQIRNLSVNDLLGREPIQLEEDRIREALSGSVVLITGGAGSIGSELCRQAAQFKPRRLVAFDQAESELFKIEMELRDKFPSLDTQAEIGDIRDLERVEEVIVKHSVDWVFHAAAYKHVPMMERHMLEAVSNNVFGTLNVVRAAYRNGVSNFLMISSDKAVNPTSIMGLTKRVAELIVSAMPVDGNTKFVSVRFGNVLGSSGSVVPIFQEQIAAGGPVTVTHPEARRYFMTVREAVQLVLQASTMGKGAEIFVLDMGEPIRIVDLARNMIRLSGHEPDEDIEIRFTGLRPGEKLFEELKSDGENLLPTYHSKIKIFQSRRLGREFLDVWVLELESLINRYNEEGVLGQLAKLVPEYQPSWHWKKAAVDGVRAATA